VLVAALGAALVARAGAGTVTSFRTPDAGAACRLQGRALVCSSLGSPGSVALRPRGVEVVKQLPWWDASTPVVRHWSHDGIACRLAGNVLLCTAGRTAVRVSGSGFSVAA